LLSLEFPWDKEFEARVSCYFQAEGLIGTTPTHTQKMKNEKG
jgi:hypothetical protein